MRRACLLSGGVLGGVLLRDGDGLSERLERRRLCDDLRPRSDLPRVPPPLVPAVDSRAAILYGLGTATLSISWRAGTRPALRGKGSRFDGERRAPPRAPLDDRLRSLDFAKDAGLPFPSSFFARERCLIRSLRVSARAAAELASPGLRILSARCTSSKYSARLPYPRSFRRAQTSQRQNSVAMQSGARGSCPVAVK